MSVLVTRRSAPRSQWLTSSIGHLFGLTLSNNGSDATNDIDIAAGTAAAADGVLMTLSASLTKRLDASWAVGTGNGGLDTGSIANTTYHVWLIQHGDSQVVDALFSTSASAPTMPSGYTRKRRIGSIMRIGGAIKAFSQVDDEFLWLVPVRDAAGTTWNTTATLIVCSVPLGIKVGALVSAEFSNAGAVFGLITSPDQTDTLPAVTQFNMLTTATCTVAFFHGIVRTDTSGQVRAAASASTGATANLFTRGWIDTRGRLA